MNINDLIALSGSNDQIAAVGRQFGLTEEQTRAAVAELAPVIGAGVRRNADSPQGLVSLLEALSRGNHTRYLDSPDAVDYGTAASEGNGILGHLFGSKDVSREVAQRAAGSTGIGSSILKKLLPIVAAMVLGGIAKKAGNAMSKRDTAPEPSRGGGIGDIITDMIGGGSSRAPEPKSGGGIGDIITDMIGGGSSGKPSPRGGGGIGDILTDILGGGRPKPAPRAEAPKRRRREAGKDSDIDMPTGEHDPFGDELGEALGSDDGFGGGGGDNPFGDGGDDDWGRYDEDTARRGRDFVDDIVGHDSRRGSAADDLLNSVERHLRTR